MFENQKKIIMMTMACLTIVDRQWPIKSIFAKTTINLNQKNRSQLRHKEADCWVALTKRSIIAHCNILYNIYIMYYIL